MAIKQEELIKEFWESTKGEHNISLEEMTKICKSPWKLLRKTMASGELPTIRFKYFGVFKVKRNRLKHSLKNLEERYKKGFASLEDYNKYSTMIKKYFDANP